MTARILHVKPGQEREILRQYQDERKPRPDKNPDKLTTSDIFKVGLGGLLIGAGIELGLNGLDTYMASEHNKHNDYRAVKCNKTVLTYDSITGKEHKEEYNTTVYIYDNITTKNRRLEIYLPSEDQDVKIKER